MTKAHLLPQQLLKRHALQGDIWDQRVWVWACIDHHFAFDNARTIRVARDRLPLGTEDFARAKGLDWWLDRTYGKRKGRAR